MSMIRRAVRALGVSLIAFGVALGALPGCAFFSGNQPSTVAQGKYYSSGEPRYDEFFIALYSLQVSMEGAPRVPDAERRTLAKALALPPESDSAAIGARLREEAQKLSHAGIHLRLDKNPAHDKDKLVQSSVTLRSSAHPKDDAYAALLNQVEQSATNLLRSIDDTSQSEELLGQLGPKAVHLDAGADTAFADSHFGKLTEVKKNLSDASQLIALMRGRAAQVRHASEALLLELEQAVNTDDGSLGPPPSAAGTDATDTPKPAEISKKPRPKNKPTGAPPPAASRPKPASESDAPAAPPKPNKAPAAPRDFEP